MKNNYRNTYAEVSLPNLYSNYLSVQKLTKGKIVIPVVKANAYGHGSIEITKFLHQKGIDYFAVSLLEEAIELRKSLPDIRILVMGVVENEGLIVASENNITVTISNPDQLITLPKLNNVLNIHIKVDTGMNRLGFKSLDEIVRWYNFMDLHPKICIEGIYTHFSTADVDKSYYDIQMTRFKNVLDALNKPFDMIHVSNSSSSIKYESNIDFTTHTRLGISLYGLTLDSSTDFLMNTYRLITRISEIKKLEKGEKVGYGATYTATTNEIIGVLPIGYADGFIRKNQGGDVEINGTRYPIVGRICMDQMFIRINDSITKHDDVIMFGGEVSIDEVANRLDTINYEVICQITYRVPKKYIR